MLAQTGGFFCFYPNRITARIGLTRRSVLSCVLVINSIRWLSHSLRTLLNVAIFHQIRGWRHRLDKANRLAHAKT